MNDLTAIYVRLSKEDLDSGECESESIQNQKSMLISYAAKNNWTIYNIYCDEDYSGAYSGDENTRPEFNKMIKDAKDGKFNIVLCKNQARFSRNTELVEQLIHGRFLEWGIRFVGMIDNADTAVKSNKKARQINSLINEWYLEELSDNIKAVFRDKMYRGEYLATFPPYGYTKDKENKHHLIKHPKTAAVVRQIFDWHGEDYGASKICRMLNARGIPNPRKQQELDGLRKTYYYAPDEPGLWSTTTIGDILNNQVYCGDVVQHIKEKVSYKSKVIKKVNVGDRIIIPDMHEPIVSREEFYETQKRLAMKRHASGTGKVHILSGKVFCYYCGKAMKKHYSKTTKGVINYLRCRDKYTYTYGEKCPTPHLRMDTVLKALQTELIEKFKDLTINEIDDKILKSILANKEDDETLKRLELDELEKESQKLQKSLEHLYNDRLNEVISLEQYISYNKTYNEKLSNVNLKIADIKDSFDSNNYKDVDNIVECVKEFLQNKQIDRRIIDNLVDRIEFGEINPETNNPILKIFWAWE